jgi:hypothetical protein
VTERHVVVVLLRSQSTFNREINGLSAPCLVCCGALKVITQYMQQMNVLPLSSGTILRGVGGWGGRGVWFTIYIISSVEKSQSAT